MKRIVLRGFSITVDFYICFKSNGEFKYMQIVVLGDQTKIKSKGITSDEKRR